MFLKLCKENVFLEKVKFKSRKLNENICMLYVIETSVNIFCIDFYSNPM